MPEMKQRLRRSITLPVILFTIVLVAVVTLTVLWHVVLFKDWAQIRELAQQAQAGGQSFHWALLALGSALFIAVVVLLSILASQLFSEIRWNDRQQNFIASVSHELNSPLSSIKLFAQTLRKPVSEEERKKFLEFILSDVDRLAQLIGNILRAAQIEELPARLEPVALGRYLEAYAAEIDSLFARRERGDTLRLEKIAPEVQVALDRALFRQVLDNLVDNATKYCRGGRVALDVSVRTSRSGWVLLDVRDDGLGLPPNELNRIFDRFYRIEGDSQRSRKGTGLGLFIVRSIVDAHGGSIHATSEGPGRGSTFTIELPRLADSHADSEEGAIAVAPKEVVSG
jgi:signal transduction histidine kinase